MDEQDLIPTEGRFSTETRLKSCKRPIEEEDDDEYENEAPMAL